MRRVRPETSAAQSFRFHGVTRRKHSGKWIAQTKVGKRNVFIGAFDSEEEAARAHDEAALRLKGPTAVTNESLGLLNGDE